MNKITAAVLTVSDRCFKGEAVDESGPNLVYMINNGVIKNAEVVKTALVPDRKDDINKMLKNWSDEQIALILTTGGTGLADSDVTPEATLPLLEKVIPGIPHLMFKRGLDVTPLSCLSRAVAGIKKKSLIINLPGSKKASKECLEAIEGVIPHAVDLIRGQKENVLAVHTALREKTSRVVVGNVAQRQREASHACVDVSEAQKMILNKVDLLRKDRMMDYEEALDHVLAEDVHATDDLPPFDCSLKDGYAVTSVDKMDVRDVKGVSRAGDSYSKLGFLRPGGCVRINTGAAVPPGCDAVVQVEDTEICEQARGEEIQIRLKKFPLKGQDVRPKGSDFKTGDLLLPCRTHLRPSAVGLLAAAGKTSVRVFVKPVVGIFSTGDEIVDPRDAAAPHKVRDSNRVALISLMKEENIPVLDLGIVPDQPNALLNSLENGFKLADVVVTTGSMSMGERDYLKEVLIADFGAKIIFGRVFMKPGKPTACAEIKFEGKPKLWFGLPGNPASAMVTAQLFILPALRAISGREKILPPLIFAHLNQEVLVEDRPQYVRAELSLENGHWRANVTGNQSSSRIGSCVNASGLLVIPSSRDTSLKRYGDTSANASVPGAPVQALLIDKIFI